MTPSASYLTAIMQNDEGGEGINMCANLMVTAWFPAGKASEIGKVFLKVVQPKVAKRVGDSPYTTATECGIEAIDLFQVDDAKLAEAMREIVKYEQEYAAAIPEYTYEVRNLLTPKEALTIIGLQPK